MLDGSCPAHTWATWADWSAWLCWKCGVLNCWYILGSDADWFGIPVYWGCSCGNVVALGCSCWWKSLLICSCNSDQLVAGSFFIRKAQPSKKQSSAVFVSAAFSSWLRKAALFFLCSAIKSSSADVIPGSSLCFLFVCRAWEGFDMLVLALSVLFWLFWPLYWLLADVAE